MSKWSLHERTTEEQARANRGRSNNGEISAVENTSPLDDDYDVNIGLSVVTGAMTGAFAVWLSHEKDK